MTSSKRILKLGQIIRFLFVGFTTVVIDAIVYTILLNWTEDVSLSKGIGFVSGAIFSYFANWRFTFRRQKSYHSIFLFALIYFSSLMINIYGNALLLYLLSSWKENVVISFIIITGITAVWNYFGMALFVFNDSKRGN